MAGRSYVFQVHELTGVACRHVLVTRTWRPDYQNASQSEDDAAHEWADREAARLGNVHRLELDAACGSPAAHTRRLVGTLYDHPFGDGLLASGPSTLRIGYATATRGHGLVVLGEAPDEAAFWAALAHEDNDDLKALAPTRPAVIAEAAFRASESLP